MQDKSKTPLSAAIQPARPLDPAAIDSAQGPVVMDVDNAGSTTAAPATPQDEWIYSLTEGLAPGIYPGGRGIDFTNVDKLKFFSFEKFHDVQEATGHFATKCSNGLIRIAPPIVNPAATPFVSTAAQGGAPAMQSVAPTGVVSTIPAPPVSAASTIPPPSVSATIPLLYPDFGSFGSRAEHSIFVPILFPTPAKRRKGNKMATKPSLIFGKARIKPSSQKGEAKSLCKISLVIVVGSSDEEYMSSGPSYADATPSASHPVDPTPAPPRLAQPYPLLNLATSSESNPASQPEQNTSTSSVSTPSESSVGISVEKASFRLRL